MNYVSKPIDGPSTGKRWDSIEQMCDHGANLFRHGYLSADTLEFQVMPDEVKAVHDYMERLHPCVPFRTMAPRGKI